MSALRINRRSFLKGTGVTLGLPLLEAMTPTARAAAAAPSTTRMVCIGVDLSLNPDTFFPTGEGVNYTLSPLLRPLEPHRRDFTVFSNLDHPEISGGHYGVHAYLSGVMSRNAEAMPEGNITVDQRAAEFVGTATRFPSLHFSQGNEGGRMSWTRSGVSVPTINSPEAIFKKLFINDTRETIRKRAVGIDADRSVLDAVRDQADWLNKRVGKHDQERLEQYFTSVRELETRLSMEKQWLDSEKPHVDYKMPKDSDGWANLSRTMPLFYDLMLLAMQTDSSRIINFQIPSTGRGVDLPGVTMGYHNLSHHGKAEDRLAQLAILEGFLLSQFAGFLDRLQNAKENGAPLLDHTMVLFGSGMGNANSHSSRNLPILLAGGGFRHQGHIPCPRRGKVATPLCNLYATMLQRFGVEAERFGTGTGTLQLG